MAALTFKKASRLMTRSVARIQPNYNYEISYVFDEDLATRFCFLSPRRRSGERTEERGKSKTRLLSPALLRNSSWKLLSLNRLKPDRFPSFSFVAIKVSSMVSPLSEGGMRLSSFVPQDEREVAPTPSLNFHPWCFPELSNAGSLSSIAGGLIGDLPSRTLNCLSFLV